MTISVGNGSSALNITRIGVGTGSGFREIQQVFVGDGSNARLVWQAFGGSTVVRDAGDYTTPVTVPNGATQVVIRAYGPGNRGDAATDEDGTWFPGQGGAGGGRSVKTLTLTNLDWGQSFTYHVGSSSEPAATSVSCSLPSGAACSLVVGTTGSGGDTNTSGSGGVVPSHTAGGSGGDGGAGVDGHGHGGSGASGNDSEQGQFGDDGYISFTFT